MKKTWKVRANSAKGYYSFYDIEAETKTQAEREAIKIFIEETGALKNECTAYAWEASYENM